MPRRDCGAVVVTIYWRDIPAQVNGQAGRERHQLVLSSKFQRAIDRAKRKAHIDTAHDDIAQWRRTTASCSGDVAVAAAEAAERLEQAFTPELLGRLAYAGGHLADLADLGDATVDRDALAALEELDADVADRDDERTPHR